MIDKICLLFLFDFLGCCELHRSVSDPTILRGGNDFFPLNLLNIESLINVLDLLEEFAFVCVYFIFFWFDLDRLNI